MMQRTPKIKTTRGISLVEMLVAVAIIAMLVGIVYPSISDSRKMSRDLDRVKALNDLEGALALYYLDHKQYPSTVPNVPAASFGSSLSGFFYNKADSSGQCVTGSSGKFSGGSSGTFTADYLAFDNSSSVGFLEELYDGGYITNPYWKDPTIPAQTDPFNCRYVTRRDEDNDAQGGRTDNVQHYLLHCNLEERADLEANDGGKNSTVYEIISPGAPWICICGTDGQASGSSCAQY
ncbi:MAG: hypothetical protein A2408_04170 [Candidatus Yonathbacteria bacterium RIFOXYC1_FULL_52_10]|uniref:Type II secretion system protein GspG C-terminal domain-containing protein n=1 Tax=Candidatus Yonathbacteria bacterium RIFOXYD1_FULL_52_36 TaxID=1802730 RepID=A0A1G2SJ57_9BACT|nr:MAG: hypothetical protein A2408_04170 [Candidatus Yonathbacteria bacterium RIFOXYC1_FULL_52_10]OHA85095.1 MAG: hypothetical protein A2591_02065 [Candidatus Yonathbacteria bacterium RIFOXYD1_FULL_52_36]